MDIIPNHPVHERPSGMPGWLRASLITVAICVGAAVLLIAGYIFLLLLTFDGTGWM